MKTTNKKAKERHFRTVKDVLRTYGVRDMFQEKTSKELGEQIANIVLRKMKREMVKSVR